MTSYETPVAVWCVRGHSPSAYTGYSSADVPNLLGGGISCGFVKLMPVYGCLYGRFYGLLWKLSLELCLLIRVTK